MDESHNDKKRNAGTLVDQVAFFTTVNPPL
jgi:hypothetical protein